MAWNHHYQPPPGGGGPQYGSAPYQASEGYRFGQSPPQQQQAYQRHQQYGYQHQQSQPGFQPQPHFGQRQYPYQNHAGMNSHPPNQSPNGPYPPNNFSYGGYNQPHYGGPQSYPGPTYYQQQQMPPSMPPQMQPQMQYPMQQQSYGHQSHHTPYGSPPAPNQRQQGRFNPYQRRKTYPSFGQNSSPSGPQQANATAPNTPGGWSGNGSPPAGFQQGYQGNFRSSSFQGPPQNHPNFQQSPSAKPPQGPGSQDFNRSFKARSASAGQTNFTGPREESDYFSSSAAPDQSFEGSEQQPEDEEPVSRIIGDTGKMFPELYQPSDTLELGHLDPKPRTWSLVVERIDNTSYWRVLAKRPPRIYPRVEEEVPVHPGELSLHQWDNFDFDGPMFAKSDEFVDPTWSIGVTIWHPPKQMTRAIHWDWKEAYAQESKPLPAPLKYEDSVSEYFQDSSNLALVDVRVSREWESLKDDLDFQPLLMDDEWTSLEEVRDNRSRVDREEERQNAAVAQEERLARLNRPQSPNIMDNLDNILAGSQEEVVLEDDMDYQNGGKSPHAMDTMEDGVIAKDNATNYNGNDEQEKILAALGVTGSPKPPKDDVAYEPWQVDTQPEQRPGPIQPQASPSTTQGTPERRQSQEKFARPSAPERRYSHETRHAGTNSRPHSRPPPLPPPLPPPPAPAKSPDRDPDSAGPVKSHTSVKDGPVPQRSPHTKTQPDCRADEEPLQTSPTPQLRRQSSGYSKKRAFDAVAAQPEDSDGGEKKRQAVDDSLRNRKRSRPAIPAAYGRR